MSYVLSYKMTAKPGSEASLGDTLTQLAAALDGMDGFEGVQILRDQADAATYRFDETWRDAAAHDAAGASLPKDVMGALMGSLAGKPEATNYDFV